MLDGRSVGGRGGGGEKRAWAEVAMEKFSNLIERLEASPFLSPLFAGKYLVGIAKVLSLSAQQDCGKFTDSSNINF